MLCMLRARLLVTYLFMVTYYWIENMLQWQKIAFVSKKCVDSHCKVNRRSSHRGRGWDVSHCRVDRRFSHWRRGWDFCIQIMCYSFIIFHFINSLIHSYHYLVFLLFCFVFYICMVGRIPKCFDKLWLSVVCVCVWIKH